MPQNNNAGKSHYGSEGNAQPTKSGCGTARDGRLAFDDSLWKSRNDGKAIRSTAERVSIFCPCCSCATDFVTSSDMVVFSFTTKPLSPINVHLERLRLSQT